MIPWIAGANIYAYLDNGNTILHQLIIKKDNEMVELLINKGVNVNFPSATNETLLHTAAKFENIEIIKYLLAQGADLTKTNSQGLLAMELSNHPKVIEAFNIVFPDEFISEFSNEVNCIIENQHDQTTPVVTTTQETSSMQIPSTFFTHPDDNPNQPQDFTDERKIFFNNRLTK